MRSAGVSRHGCEASRAMCSTMHSAAAARPSISPPLRRVMLGALAVQALLLLLFAQTQTLWLALLRWGAQNGAGVLVNIAIMSLRQQIVPDGMLGRVTTVSRTLGFAAIPLSALLGGVLIDRLGDVALVYSAVAVLTLLVAVSFARGVLGYEELRN